MHTFTKEDFREALLLSIHELARNTSTPHVYAAPLATRITKHLRAKLEDAGKKEEAEGLKLTGRIFGPVLFENSSPAALKFRDFLKAFSEEVEVYRGPRGDMVKLVNPRFDPRSLDSRALVHEYHSLLRKYIKSISKEPRSKDVPANQLALRLKKMAKEQGTRFDLKLIGYSSLSEWLQAVPGVDVHTVDGVARVVWQNQDFGSADFLNGAERTGYLLVDATDTLFTICDLLGGEEPSPNQMPDWGKVLRYCRNRWSSIGSWEGRYLAGLLPEEARRQKSFFNYLQDIGYRVLRLSSVEGQDPEESRSNRALVSKEGLEKAVNLLEEVGSPDGLLVVGHHESLGPVLEKRLQNRPSGLTGVIGFKRKMPEQLLALQDRGLLIIDIEKDCRAFNAPIEESLQLEDLTAELVL